MPKPYRDDSVLPAIEPGASPQHGYRGESVADGALGVPAGLTIAISREAGSRGGAIAARAGAKLGWEVYSQEMLEFGAQNADLRRDLFDKLTPAAVAWIEEHFENLQEERDLTQQPNLRDLARLVLTLGVQGIVIMLGRARGFLLPSEVPDAARASGGAAGRPHRVYESMDAFDRGRGRRAGPPKRSSPHRLFGHPLSPQTQRRASLRHAAEYESAGRRTLCRRDRRPPPRRKCPPSSAWIEGRGRRKSETRNPKSETNRKKSKLGSSNFSFPRSAWERLAATLCVARLFRG